MADKTSTLKQTDTQQLLRELQRRSVQTPGTGAFPIQFIQIAHAADEAPVWWSPARDAYLRKFFPTEPYLCGALYSVIARNAAYKLEFRGNDNTAVERAKQLLYTTDFFKGWYSFAMKLSLDLLCVAGKTRVRLGGDRLGKTKSIARIVKEHDPGPVLSLDGEGHIVERSIVEWHKTPLGGRRWWWLSLSNASHCGPDGKKGGVFVTEDHPILTDHGWLMARDVKVGMQVACGDPSPSQEQMQVLTGGLLGDMSVGFVRKRAMLRFSHSVEQEEWLDFKLASLRGFQWTGRNYYEDKNGYITVGVNSRASLGLVHLRQGWYTSTKGSKVVNRNVVRQYFSPRMMAVWWCDDGTLTHNYTRAGNETTSHGYLCTNGFSESEVQWLADFLCERGFPCKLYRFYNKKQHKAYPVIYVSPEAIRRLTEFIGAYVPPPMRYKLPSDAAQFDPSLWDIESAGVHYDEVAASEPKAYKSGKGTVQTTYHIGVGETRNFFTTAAVVHNSQDNFAFGEIVRPARVKILGGLAGDFERYNGGTFRASRAPVRTKSGEVVPSWHALIPYPKGWYSLEGIEYEVKDSEFDLPIGLNHLDAARCTRTGDPETPVTYTDTEGIPHHLKWYQVFTLEDMPCSDETRYGVGYCAVSRCLRLAQTLRDIQIYKQEKVTGQFAGSVWLTNVPDQFITDAIVKSKEAAKAENLLRYMTPVIAYTMEPNAQPYAFEIKLASLPDGFKEEEALRWYIAGVALAFAVDYGFLAPLPGGKLGTSEQAEVAERQSRGKASRLFMSQMELILNYRGILQEGVWVEYKEVDVEEELARDTARERRAKTRATMIESGEITSEMAAKMAVEVGDYSDDYLKMRPKPEEEEEGEDNGGNGKADRRWWNVGFGRRPADEAMEPQEKSLGDVLTGILSKVPGVKKKTPVISAHT